MKDEDLVGKTFGYLTVLQRYSDGDGKKKWLCKCICGREVVVIDGNLKTGNSIRCGNRDCPSKYKDISNQRFGKLVAQEYLGLKQISKDGRRASCWLCKCDCGNTTEVTYHNLISGHTKSCGCLHKEVVSKNSYRHGDSRTILYRRYIGMKDRCYNQNATEYDQYGGRGIRVCDEWFNDYTSFKRWSLDNGFRKELSIDRINVNGNYEPKNCRWATTKEQAENRQNNHIVRYNGKEYILTRIASEHNICVNTFRYRLEMGWDADKIISYYEGEQICQKKH